MQILARAFTFFLVTFVAGLAVVIGARLDQLTLSLLGGVMVGVAVAAPIASLVTYLALRHRSADSFTTGYAQPCQQHNPQPISPQFILLPPPSNYQAPLNARSTSSPTPMYQPVEPFSMAQKRRFYIIGGDGAATELLPEPEQSPVIYPHVDAQQH